MVTTWTLQGPDGELWGIADVCKHFGWSRSKLTRLIAAGEFPAGRDLGGRPMWTGADIAAYVLLAGRWRPQESPKNTSEED